MVLSYSYLRSSSKMSRKEFWVSDMRYVTSRGESVWPSRMMWNCANEYSRYSCCPGSTPTRGRSLSVMMIVAVLSPSTVQYWDISAAGTPA